MNSASMLSIADNGHGNVCVVLFISEECDVPPVCPPRSKNCSTPQGNSDQVDDAEVVIPKHAKNWLPLVNLPQAFKTRFVASRSICNYRCKCIIQPLVSITKIVVAKPSCRNLAQIMNCFQRICRIALSEITLISRIVINLLTILGGELK